MAGSVARYSGGAILLHWLIAFLLAGEIALGFVTPRDASGFELFQLHKSIGITILVLSLLRLGWRLTHARPAKIEGGVNGFLASAVHIGFYAVMILMPLSGWAIVSTSDLNIPTVLFGVVPLPHLPLPDAWSGAFEETHEIIALAALGLFVLHVVGALRHHFLMRDTLLARMGPGGSGGAVLGLMAAVIVLGATVYFTVGDRNHGGDDHDHSGSREVAALPASGADEAGRVALETDEAETLEEPVEEATEPDETSEEISSQAPAAQAPTSEALASQALAAAAGPPPSWTIQPGGTLRFTVEEDAGAINGSFTRWSGAIVMDPERPETAEIAITIQLASATVSDATRDAMLVGGDFLSATANPTAIWRATSVRRLGGNRYQADGTLSLKGASRPQRITFTLTGTGQGAGARRSVRGNATIDRTAFGVGVGSNAASLRPQVTLNFAFDATR